MVDPEHLQRALDALSAIAMPVASEARLHELVEAALAAAGVAHEHEVDLGEGRRIDFLTAGGVGIEVKIAGARNEILRQLHGYAQADRVLAVVLFTTRAAHALAAESLNGKPLVVVRSKGWL
jgi:hypothetical protein